MRLKAFLLGRHIFHLSLQRENAEVRVSSLKRWHTRYEENVALKIERQDEKL